MIRAIIFDLGKVIYDFDNNIFLENISRYTDKSVPELNELIYNSSDLPRQFETGLISPDKFFNGIRQECSLSISKEEFKKAYTGIFTPIQSTINLIPRLKKKYKIGLLSNTSQWDFEEIIKTCNVNSLFDSVSLSYQIGVMKPGHRIFLDSLRKLKLGPEECVFIDDIEMHVQAAVKLAFHGVHYVSHEVLISSLNGLNVQT